MGAETKTTPVAKGHFKNKKSRASLFHPRWRILTRYCGDGGSAQPHVPRPSRAGLKSSGAGPAAGAGPKVARAAAVAAAAVAKTQASGTVVVFSRRDRLCPFAQRKTGSWCGEARAAAASSLPRLRAAAAAGANILPLVSDALQ